MFTHIIKVKGKPNLLVCTPLRKNDSIYDVCLKSIQNQKNVKFNWFSYASDNNAAYNRNKCFDLAIKKLGYTPRYILFSDNDINWINENAFYNLRNVLKTSNKKIAFSYCSFRYIFTNSKNSTSRTIDFKAFPFDRFNLFRSNYISTMSMLKTKDFISCGKFNEKLVRFQDWELWLRLSFMFNKRGKPVKDSENIYFIAENDESTSISGTNPTQEQLSEFLKIREHIFNKYIKNTFIRRNFKC